MSESGAPPPEARVRAEAPIPMQTLDKLCQLASSISDHASAVHAHLPGARAAVEKSNDHVSALTTGTDALTAAVKENTETQEKVLEAFQEGVRAIVEKLEEMKTDMGTHYGNMEGLLTR